MHNNKVTFSIVTCVYNGSDFISSYIDAIVNISDLVDQIVVVNDGSSDDSLSKLEEASNNIDILEIKSKGNTGLADSRNFGLNYVTSDYVIFLDIDDVIPRDSLLHGIKTVSESNVDFLYGNIKYFSSSKNTIKNEIISYVKSKLTPSIKSVANDIFYNNYLVTPGNCIFRTSIV
ncbi:glycosyltransferase family 2 protein, partial [Vibrio splendidus]